MKAELLEQNLLIGLTKNDSKAIETIYKQNFSIVQSLVLNNSGSYDDARDIFQESLITLYEKASQEGFALSCKISTYLYSVARRLWLKRLQHLGKFITSMDNLEETVSLGDDIEIHQKRDNDYEIMERALSSMGEPCKSILEGFYIKKMDMQTLAKEFGYTNADNAKNQKYKCLIRLKKLFFTQYNIGE